MRTQREIVNRLRDVEVSMVPHFVEVETLYDCLTESTLKQFGLIDTYVFHTAMLPRKSIPEADVVNRVRSVLSNFWACYDLGLGESVKSLARMIVTYGWVLGTDFCLDHLQDDFGIFDLSLELSDVLDRGTK